MEKAYLDLGFLDEVIRDSLSNLKNKNGDRLITFVCPETRFDKMAIKIVRSYLNYHSVSDQYDIVIESFTKKFLGDSYKSFYNFEGFYVDKNGESKSIKIETYIFNILKRSMISLSLRRKREYLLKERNESIDFDFLEMRISRDSLSESPYYALIYKELLESFKKEMALKARFSRKNLNLDLRYKVLDYMLEGYNNFEIAKAMNVSDTRVDQISCYLKKSLRGLAISQSYLGDDKLLNHLNCV